MLRVGSGGYAYEWVENWANLPTTSRARNGWAHPGIADAPSGEVVTAHPGDPTILVFNARGRRLRPIETGDRMPHCEQP